MLTVFGAKNDVIRLTAKNNFQLDRLAILQEYSEKTLNVKKSFLKPHLVAEIWNCKDHQISKNTMSCSNKVAEKYEIHSSITSRPIKLYKYFFSHLSSSVWALLKVLACYAISQKLFLRPILWRHFLSKTIKNPKPYDCWKNEILLSCKGSAQNG